MCIVNGNVYQVMDYSEVIFVLELMCYSRIAGQQSREGCGEQITNVANAPTFIVNKPHL